MTDAQPVGPRLVGVIHLPPLPSSPRSELSLDSIEALCADDARALAQAGFDAIIVENFGDAPFFATRVPEMTVAAMTRLARRVVSEAPDCRVGVNVLRNDAHAAIAVALASGASFVRINVHVRARVTDQGIIEGEAATTLRTRRAWGAEHVDIWADVGVKHSSPLGAQDLESEAAEAAERGLADALLITGTGTGHEASPADAERVRAGASGARLLVASGVRLENVASWARAVDGIVVGSALRRDGRAGGPIDPSRAAALADAYRRASGVASG